MRTGINQGQTDDYLLPSSPPTHNNPISPPSPTHPKSLSKSHSTTLSIATSFPVPPSTYPSHSSRFSTTTTQIQQPLPASVLSPDEMLRAYAARKKSLADAASAGIRLSGSGSSSSVGASPMTPGAQTVSSIHATGMRVAYHTNVTPLGDSASGSKNTNNPFVSSSLHISTPSSSDRAQYAIGDVEDEELEQQYQHQHQELEGGADEYDYAYAYAYDTPQPVHVEGESEVDVGFAGRGAFGYHHQNQPLA